MASFAPRPATPTSSTRDTGTPPIARHELGTSFLRPCGVCGEALQAEPGRRGPKRLHHPGCARVLKYLTATERALHALGTLPADRAAMVRRRVLAAANILPTRWERPRDPRGRFTKDCGAPPGELVRADNAF